MHLYYFAQLLNCNLFGLHVNFVSLSIFHHRESGEPSKRKPYLPTEKQFLITRNGNAIGHVFSLFQHQLLWFFHIVIKATAITIMMFILLKIVIRLGKLYFVNFNYLPKICPMAISYSIEGQWFQHTYLLQLSTFFL